MSTLLQEFQVVIFAGGEGRLLKPLTDDKPKCLLPVANRPLLSYQLEFLVKTGFREVIVVTTTSYEEDVSRFLKEETPGDLVVSLEIVEDYLGSAATLLHIKSKLKRHFILMKCDLIVENNFFLHHMADLHRAEDAAVTMLVHSTPPPEEKGPIKRDKIKQIEYIGLHENRLVMCESNKNVDDDKPIKIPKPLLIRFPNFTLHTDLRNAHFCIFSSWTLDILEANKQQIQSINGDFIPFLTKLQARTKKIGFNPPLYLSNETYQSSSSGLDPLDKIKCFAWRFDTKAYCARINSLDSYMEVNRAIATGSHQYLPYEPESTSKHKHFISPTAKVHEKTQIPSECVVGAFSTIGEKVGVKKSIIGKHCKIANSAKILNSVLMDHVTVGEGVKIQNSIVGANSYIDAESSLTDCQLGSGCRVEPGVHLTRKKMSALGGELDK